jgi:tetratricopeptide (TPR) repeat protein
VAEEFLLQSLRDDPNCGDALWCLAAVRWLRGDRAGLAEQPTNQPEILDERSRFFAGLCRLAAGDFSGALETCARSGGTEAATLSGPAPNGAAPPPRLSWAVEYSYLAGLAHLGLGQNAAAAEALEKPALSPDSPSAAHAQALLGTLGFMDSNHEEAAKWWRVVDHKKRSAWKLNETLAQTVFLTALEAYARGNFEEAAERLRAAGKLGCRDRRLGTLLVTSLFKAGQAMIYGNSIM